MMTQRTYANYSPAEAVALCRPVTLETMEARGVDRNDLVFRELDWAAQTHRGCLVIEWPDGVLSCVVSAYPVTFSDLVPGQKVGAYQKRAAGGDLFYSLD